MKNSLAKSEDTERILILGHSGFIGAHLMRYFCNSLPEIEVVGYSFPELDLTKEKETFALSHLFDLKTLVIMCAAIKRQIGDNHDTFLQNVSMAVNVSRLLEEHPVKRFVFFSSAAVYGEDVHNTSITEDTPVCPTSYYGIAKYASERLFKKVAGQRKGSSLLILRPPLIYGPGDTGSTYGPVKFIKSALNKQEIILWGDGAELREFIFVEDIAKIVYDLSFSDFDGVINIASGKSHSFNDVIEALSLITPDKLIVRSHPRTKNRVDNVFCNNKISKLLKNFSFTNLEDGVGHTFDFEKKMREECLVKTRKEDGHL